jgi:hypothetical protein
MKQACKYCGVEVEGEQFLDASPAVSQGYQFWCDAPGPHGPEDEGRVWYAATPDSFARERAEGVASR